MKEFYFYEKWESWPETQRLGCWNSLSEPQQKLRVWNLLTTPQKLNHWISLDKAKREELWILLKGSEKEFYEILASCPEDKRLGCWNSLSEPQQKRGVWNLLTPPQKLSLWIRISLDKAKKKELWSLWEDSINVFWNSLKYPERKKFWNSLEISYKAEFLKILSENYTLAQIVFAARKRVEDSLKEYNIKNVYITLVDEEKGPPVACIEADPPIRYSENNYSLFLRIAYSTNGGITKYNKNYISRSCARFLVGHEIWHILSNLENIIKEAEAEEGL